MGRMSAPADSTSAITVLAKPGFRVAAGPASGSSCVSLYSRLQARGMRIVEWSPRRMILGTYDVLHLHWPDNILSSRSSTVVVIKMLLLFGSLAIVRLRGRRVVWTAHNLDSHAQRHPMLEAIYWREFPKLVHGILAPLRSIRKRLLSDSRFRGVRRIEVTPFGDWSDFYSTCSKRDLRREFGIPDSINVVLWFGAVQPYKGIEALLQTFRDRRLRDTALIIAGRCSNKRYRSELESAADGMENVRLLLKFIPDKEVADFFNAANICAFPFKEISNTGSVRLALTFNRHVLVPDFPFARELEQVLGSEWFTIYPPGGLDAGHVAAALDEGKAVSGRKIDWGTYNWDHTAEITASFFSDIVADTGR